MTDDTEAHGQGSMAAGPRLALYAPSGTFEAVRNPFGKDTANLGLFRALALHGGFEELGVLSNQEASRQDVKAALCGNQVVATEFWTGSVLRASSLLRAGAVLRGKADLADLAWLRNSVDPRGYSLIGLIHTIAPPAIRDQIASLTIAPIQPWDALICTSPSVQSAMAEMFDEYGEYLAHRFGVGAVRHRPRLPLVPLGVDAARIAQLADRPDVRSETRQSFGLDDDAVLVFWLGRLSFFEKAFPQPMFRALSEAQNLADKAVHFVMAGWFPDGDEGRARYEEAARAYAPSVKLHFVDGNDSRQIGALWAASDVFLSLVDNIQETFGLTPLEAMAARLPVVASDWDGYAYTIEENVTGFLIPTLGAPPGLGQLMSSRHVLGIDSYQAYVGTVAQHTAVDVGRAAKALARLFIDPNLRQAMGDAGRKRVQSMFDWPVVATQIRDLVIELGILRRHSAPFGTSLARPSGNPIKGDPFRQFANFASGTMGPDTVLFLREAGVLPNIHHILERTRSVRLDMFGAAWRGAPANLDGLLQDLLSGPKPVEDLLAKIPESERPFAQLALVWMCKLGVLGWNGGA